MLWMALDDDDEEMPVVTSRHMCGGFVLDIDSE